MKFFVKDIKELTIANQNFRQVIHTGQHAQLVAMSLLPNEDIGMEVHEVTDQFLKIEKGEGKVVINREEQLLKNDSAIFVPAGTQHNIINTSSSEKMKLYTLYSPPHHKDGTIHKTKQDAESEG